MSKYQKTWKNYQDKTKINMRKTKVAVKRSIFKVLFVMILVAFVGIATKNEAQNGPNLKTEVQMVAKQAIEPVRAENEPKAPLLAATSTGTFKVIIGIKDSLAGKNNNPGNLVYAGQRGAVKGFGGFAMFDTPEDGYRAVIDQVKLDQSRKMTLRKFVTKYAPPKENNTWLYIQTISKNLAADADDRIGDLDSERLAQEIIRFESQSILIYQ